MRVPRLLAVVLAALPLSGCLDYDVEVRTEVAPDGGFRRTVFVHENSDEHKTWSNFAKPGEAYALTGSDEEGFTATAEGAAGTLPSGLRVVLDDQEHFVEGEVTVDVDDLLVGTLYRYRETLALGVDSAVVRAEAGPLLETLLDNAVAVLEEMEPEVDFFPVFEVAHERVLPRVEASLLVMQQAIAALARDHREHVLRPIARDDGDLDAHFEFDGITLDGGRVADDPRLRLCLAELARYGIVYREGAEEGSTWAFEPFVLDELLRPVSDLSDERRAALIGRILHEKEFGEIWNRTWKERHPDDTEETRALEARGARWAAGVAGALFLHGFADSHDLRFRVDLPGTLLYANGELGGLPAVRWRLDSGDCAFGNPVLVAISFVPRDGLPARGWSLKELDALRVSLDALDDAQRRALAALYAEQGPGGLDPAAIEGHDDRVHAACTVLQTVLRTVTDE